MSRRKSKKSGLKSRRTRAIKLESLERRELLAGDIGHFHNSLEPLDVNDDAEISPVDALVLINELNRTEPATEGERGARPRSFNDVNNDGQLSPVDALMVVNGINRRFDAERRGDRAEREPRPEPDPALQDEVPSLDGTGNNIGNPDLGSAGQAFERWAEVDYADGFASPAGGDRVSAREVSNIVNDSPGDIENQRGLSDLTWIWGQFIDHDITLSGEGHSEAFNIDVPAGDPEFDPTGTGEQSIAFERSGYEVSDEGIREQLNTISAFIDGSVIYGSDRERADALREFEGGRLLTSEGDLLPFNTAGLTNAGGPSESLFLAGDIRANENAALTAMHTIWVREHNRIADDISRENPGLSDEEVFQQARRIVTAELQSITYNEFLPALLGEDAISDYQGYDSSVNPNLSNVFSTAAYRFGHTMLSPELLRLDENGEVIEDGNLPLQTAFFNVGAVTGDGIDVLLRGASVQAAQEVDPFLVDDVRNFLFGPPGSGGFDLAALNIQRGRDHGLPSYNAVREQMGLEAVSDFSDITSDAEVIQRLEQAYGDVDSVDAWVGMLAEEHAAGSALGITASTIIAEQFTALRDGDRFYFENIFAGRELRDIQRTSLADVIERNSDVDFGRGQNVFFATELGADTSTRDNDGRDIAQREPRQADDNDERSRRSAPPVFSPGAVDIALADLDAERRNRRLPPPRS